MKSRYRFEKTIFNRGTDVFLEMLVEARKKAGLTQVEIAEALKCRQTFISKIERGERRLDVLEFLHICPAYEIKPGKFLEKVASALPGRREKRS